MKHRAKFQVAGTSFGLALGLALAAISPGIAQAPGGKASTDVSGLVRDWPESSRKAAMAMVEKYGQPQEATEHLLIWHENGPWKWTRLFREEVDHNFPMPHKDVLEQAIDYDVPVDLYDDLARYDGSVIAERTKGQLSARCDMEGANFLAINLAHDIAQKRRDVDDARSYYSRAIADFKASGAMDPYMMRLSFTPPEKAGDPDQATLKEAGK